MAIQGVQTQNTEEKKVYPPLPDGEYSVKLSRFLGQKRTGNDNGDIVNVSYQVTDGDFKNRIVWDSFLISHTNMTAAGIGLKNLDNLLKSIGVHGGFEAIGNDSGKIEEFLDREFIVKLKTEIPKDPKYKPRNKVVSYSRK